MFFIVVIDAVVKGTVLIKHLFEYKSKERTFFSSMNSLQNDIGFFFNN